MTSDSFYASEVGWMEESSCKGAQFNFTPDVEDPDDLEYVRGTWCYTCPVRTECLAYALLYRATGYWGGTGTAERRLLSYARNRVRCPVCRSKALVKTAEGHEICQGCGLSWASTSGPRLPEEAAG